jgi:hypothetical protein
MGHLEQPGLGPYCTRDASHYAAEQLELQETVRARGAVELHEGTVRPRTSSMGQTGQKALTNSDLTTEQDRRGRMLGCVTR